MLTRVAPLGIKPLTPRVLAPCSTHGGSAAFLMQARPSKKAVSPPTLQQHSTTTGAEYESDSEMRCVFEYKGHIVCVAVVVQQQPCFQEAISVRLIKAPAELSVP